MEAPPLKWAPCKVGCINTMEVPSGRPKNAATSQGEALYIMSLEDHDPNLVGHVSSIFLIQPSIHAACEANCKALQVTRPVLLTLTF
jgi:hypothetical protein